MVLQVKSNGSSWLLCLGCYLFAGLIYLWPQYTWQLEYRLFYLLVLLLL
ncbi:MAG: hypothetical protein GXP22_07810 [Gammaproteobacteria bacterium]|nr:hypothetical protein [Gammaproteobacteria bacterium]